jgi:transcriptional regulator with XRE-family HTH domain
LDDIRFGVTLRAARIRHAWSQRELARRAGVSDAIVSRLERGHVDGIAVGKIRRISKALDIRVDLAPRSRAADMDRLVAGKHAALAEAIIRWLRELGGWVVRPEVSFSRYGERGVIDLLAWHQGRRVLLVIELKTAIIDIGELVGTLDRKVRNAWDIARSMGWEPLVVSSLLIVGEGATNRRRVAAHAATFDAAYPIRAAAIRRWLRAPEGRIHGLMFFADRRPGQVSESFATRQRVSARDRAGSRPRIA